MVQQPRDFVALVGHRNIANCTEQARTSRKIPDGACCSRSDIDFTTYFTVVKLRRRVVGCFLQQREHAVELEMFLLKSSMASTVRWSYLVELLQVLDKGLI